MTAIEPSDADTPATGGPTRARLDRTLTVAALAIAVFGDILAFNQLATQSPIDANLVLMIFVVGFAGLVEGLRRAIVGGDTTARLIGVGILALAALSLVAWLDRWSTETQGLIVLAAAIVLGLLSGSLLWRHRRDDADGGAQLVGLLALGQAIIAMWFGVLAIAALGA